MVTNNGDCFKCGKPGHWAQHCPLNERAATIAEHEERIRQLGDRYAEKEITPEERRRLIIAENELWHGKQKTGARK